MIDRLGNWVLAIIFAATLAFGGGIGTGIGLLVCHGYYQKHIVD